MQKARGILFVLAVPLIVLVLAWLASALSAKPVTPIPVDAAACPAGWTTSPAADFGSPSGSLNAVAATSASDVWTVGYAFPQTRRGTQSLIEHWDGSAWQAVSSPNTPSTYNNLNAVAAVSASDAWAAGSAATPPNRDTFIEHWNGSSWRIVLGASGVGPYSSLDAIAGLSSSDAWAVGYSSSAEHSPSDALIEHWNGSSWQIVPAAGGAGAYASLEAVVPLSAGDVWAFGNSSTSANGPGSALIEHWDGNSWTAAPSPGTGSESVYLASASAVSSTDIWVAGEVGSQTLTEHWDGNSWQIVPSANPGSNENFFNGIAAALSNDVWAVGVQRNADSEVRALIEHWNGATWQVVPDATMAMPGSPLDGIALASPEDLWAVGSQDAGSGLLIEHLCRSIQSLTWGDTNCLNSVDFTDVEDTLRNLGGLTIVPGQICPEIGSAVALAGFPQLMWGDWT